MLYLRIFDGHTDALLLQSTCKGVRVYLYGRHWRQDAVGVLSGTGQGGPYLRYEHANQLRSARHRIDRETHRFVLGEPAPAMMLGITMCVPAGTVEQPSNWRCPRRISLVWVPNGPGKHMASDSSPILGSEHTPSVERANYRPTILVGPRGTY